MGFDSVNGLITSDDDFASCYWAGLRYLRATQGQLSLFAHHGRFSLPRICTTDLYHLSLPITDVSVTMTRAFHYEGVLRHTNT